ALAGCGSSNPGGTTADPASVVPASVALYVGASVRPQGTLKTNALAAGHALTGQGDPYLQLLAALQTPGSPKLSFAHDVSSWLGPNGGVFLSSLHDSGSLPSLLEQGLLGGSGSASFPFGSGGAQGAIVLDTSNASAARSFLNTQAAHAGAHPKSLDGTSYDASAGGVAFALVQRFAVIGSESGVRSVIDAAHGAGALVHASDYSKLVGQAPAGALAHVYTNAGATAAGEAQAGSSSQAGGEQLSQLLRVLAGANPANVSLIPTTSSLSLAADTLSPAGAAHTGGLLEADPEAAQAFDELPGEAWLAIGLGHLASDIDQDAQDIEALTSLGSPGPLAPSTGISFSSLLQGLLTPLHALGASTPQARSEFASWMGSAGVFASGANLAELKAGVAISSTDPARSRAAVSELAAQLRKGGAKVSPTTVAGTEAAVSVTVSGLPVALDIADGRASNGRTKLVIGVGEQSVADALDPPTTLSSAAPSAAAASGLGEGIHPSLLVNFPTFISLLEGVGLLEQPPISQVLPYLRASSSLIGGGRQLGGEAARFRLVLGLQNGAGEASG
ncbi:MAG TPA: hypothetical protein VK765_05170, partial [Solirubrobacteraceae bacterium]|nr:hypothetical protein [Solirubrobacteraceae bacterium]